MNDLEHGDLLNMLDSLNLDVPPMPEGFHEGWAGRLEDEPPMKKKLNRQTLTRILAAAAALIFVVGGATLAGQTRKRDGMVAGATQNSRGMIAMDLGAMPMEAVEYEEDAAYENGMAMTAGKSSMTTAPTDRMLVRTASLTITTQTYDESLSALTALCASAGGWTASSSERTTGSGQRTCYLTLRVPAEQLGAFLSGTDELGEVTQRAETAEDVTESYQDTRGRLATQQALMDRLQALVTSAASLSELLELEVQIADTQYQIDRLQSQLNTTERKVNYATVDVTLREEDAEAAAKSGLGAWLREVFQSGGETFVASLENAVIFLAAARPFLAVIAIVWLAARLIRGRKRR